MGTGPLRCYVGVQAIQPSFSLPPPHHCLPFAPTLSPMEDALADALDRFLTLSGNNPYRGKSATPDFQYFS